MELATFFSLSGTGPACGAWIYLPVPWVVGYFENLAVY